MIEVRRNRSGVLTAIQNGDLVINRKKNIVGEIEYLNSWSFEVAWADGSRGYYSAWYAYRSLIFITGGEMNGK